MGIAAKFSRRSRKPRLIPAFVIRPTALFPFKSQEARRGDVLTILARCDSLAMGDLR